MNTPSAFSADATCPASAWRRRTGAHPRKFLAAAPERFVARGFFASRSEDADIADGFEGDTAARLGALMHTGREHIDNTLAPGIFKVIAAGLWATDATNAADMPLTRR